MADEENEQSPFARPSFIFAAIGVAVIVVAGVIVGVNVATRDDGGDALPPPPITTSAAPTTEPSEVAGGASVCGLVDGDSSDSVTTAPAAKWVFQGTTGYPTSDQFGPGETDAANVRSCFQHSATGAVFATANALVQATDPSIVEPWAKYFIGEGPNRAALLAQLNDPASEEANTRLTILGFRVLAYDGDTARVDIAVRGSAQGKTITGSYVYELVWQNGDWRANASLPEPFNFAVIPDTAGYIGWGE